MRTDIAPQDPADAGVKWKQLCDLAIATGQLNVAESCAMEGDDLNTLLLLHTSFGRADKLKELGARAAALGKANVAYMARLLSGDVDGCIEVLLEGGRVPEAAFFARTYAPSQVSRIVALWKADLGTSHSHAATMASGHRAAPSSFDCSERRLDISLTQPLFVFCVYPDRQGIQARCGCAGGPGRVHELVPRL